MIRMNKVLIILLVMIPICSWDVKVEASAHMEHFEENCFSVYDEDGNYIFSTAMGVSLGDRYINEENHEYRVIEVEMRRATAEFLGVVDLLALEDLDNGVILSVIQSHPIFTDRDGQKIGIYHTHTAESYLPPEAFTEGFGDIHAVGSALAREMRENGLAVQQAWTNHLPHDGAAYDRSRRTVIDLMKNDADVLLDLHRDGVPRREEYTTLINGTETSKVRLVVGRQNPNMKVNDQMARRIKAVGDEMYPGLIKGIFYANGKYNQDLSPWALLLEVGTHVSSKEEALASVSPMSNVLINALFGAEALSTSSRSAVETVLIIIGLALAGTLIYLYLNEGNWTGVIKRLEHFFTVEFRDLLRSIPRFRKKSGNE